jgi:HAD superfamily hydrolase (TIGR01509 family)
LSLRNVSAVSFDFFNTLVTQRHGLGRGALVMEYFRAQGWESDNWEHGVLYDVFAAHGAEFEPEASLEEHRVFCARVALALFNRMRVQVDTSVANAHGIELWRILGPEHLVLFPDVTRTLARLRKAGLRLVVVSNWQCGLSAFCRALGVAEYFEAVLASAEVGSEKPNLAIFTELCRRLVMPGNRVLHVGDTEIDDVEGARRAGLHALWLQRNHGNGASAGAIRSLEEVANHLGIA